jgi:cation diffusion facilitator family transporter
MPSLAEALRHDHDHGVGASLHEKKTRWVVALTFAMMTGELVFGYLTGSLALTADGWHMATHVGALGLGSLAYWYARTHTREAAFSFGTGKVHALAGYTSAIVLAVIALWMFYESGLRLANPVVVDFRDAIGVSALALLTNLLSVRLLHVDHGHESVGHDHAHAGEQRPDHPNPHEGHHHEPQSAPRDHVDPNLRASYLHVLADTVTSVLTILALLGGRYLGWERLDPIVGIIGGVVILRWSLFLCRDAAAQLLDMVPSTELAARLRGHLEALPGTEVVDLHVWQIGPSARACLATVISETDRSPLDYASELRRRDRLAHVTVEVHRGQAV